jgi:hypothetical protein
MLRTIGYVKASNTEAGDLFGYTMAISEDGATLAVGAPNETSHATGVDGDQQDNSAPIAGAVYVYTRSESGWAPQAYVKASNTDEQDLFGYSVALSGDGNTLAVGAYQEASSTTGVNGDQSDNAAFRSGAVYVFTRSDGTWTQQAYVKASNTQAADSFGTSVALDRDGNTLAVGAVLEASSATGINGNQADNSAVSAGAVYLYSRNGATWSQQAYVKASNTDAFDYFGNAVALSGDGNTLAVGAYGESSSARGIDGDQTDNSASGSGAVYVYVRSSGSWSQQAYVKKFDTLLGQYFGFNGIALSGNGDTLAVGDHLARIVYVYTRSVGIWTTQTHINTLGFDDFGYALALSADGATLAVGARYESSSATGINGNQADNSADLAGAAYVFTRTGDIWVQQAYVKAPNTDADDQFGSDVAISGDGNTLAVGAFGEASRATGIGGDQTDNTAPGAGAAYLY